MGRVISNDCALQESIEDSLETLAASPEWRAVPRTDLPAWGAEVTNEESKELGPNRRRQDSTPTDLNSRVAIADSLRMGPFRRFLPSFICATPTAPGDTGVAVFAPTAVVAGTAADLQFDVTGQPTANDTVTIDGVVYTYKASLSAAYEVLIGTTAEASLDNLIAAINGAAGEGATYGAGTDAHPSVSASKVDSDSMLVTARNEGTDGNNIVVAETHTLGAWETASTQLANGTDGSVTVPAAGDLNERTLVRMRGNAKAENNGLKMVGASSTTTSVKISNGDLETETTPSQSQLDVCGYRGAAGDLEIDADGNLISTSLVFTTLNLTVGSRLLIGGDETVNRFATAANNGSADIIAIAANKLTLAHRTGTFALDDGAGKQIDIYFGEFIRDVDKDDPAFLDRSHQFELSFPGQGPAGATTYEYSKGNYANELGLTMPQRGLVTASYGFTGTDTDDPTTTRATNGADGIPNNQGLAFSTAIHYTRIKLADYSEADLSTVFQTWSLRIANGVEPEKIQGKLGAGFMNRGEFILDVSATALFTNPDLAARIRNGTIIRWDVGMANDDGGWFLTVPSGKLAGRLNGFPVNQSVTLQTTIMAIEDASLGYSVGVTIFPYVPTSHRISTPL